MQKKVKEFNSHLKQFGVDAMNPLARMIDLQSEVGELSKEILKGTQYGTSQFEPKENFFMEIGDVLYALLSLCEETNTNAEECLGKVIEKYNNRLKAKQNLDSGN